MNKAGKTLTKISPGEYTKEYFLTIGGGGAQYEKFKKGDLPDKNLLQALNYLPKNHPGLFLDLGCGRGELVIYLGRQGKRAIGIDYSLLAIKICQDTLEKETQKVKKLVSFQVAKATDLPFKDRFFGAVFLLDVVEHLTSKQLEKTLREIYRVLKKGGVLIIHTNNKHFEVIGRFLIGLTYHGLKFLWKSRDFQDSQLSAYRHLHINYQTAGDLAEIIQRLGFSCQIDFIKPEKKEDLRKYLAYGNPLKEWLFYNLAWLFLLLPTLEFLAPTFWLRARKT